MTFRLTTLLYLFALVASSMAVLGPLGVLIGAYIFAIWWGLTRASKKYPTWPGVLELFIALVLIPGILVALLTPAVQYGGSRSRDTTFDLKGLASAIRHFQHDHGHLPGPFAIDQANDRLYSWRATILPYLKGNTLASKFQYDEPWDSSANRQLLIDLDDFQSFQFAPDLRAETHYLAVVGPGTVWDPDAVPVALQDVSDGLDCTILLIAAPQRGIHWSEPRDLSLKEAVALLSDDATKIEITPGYFVSQHFEVPAGDGYYIALVDGSVHWLPPGIDSRDAKALCTRAGGERLKPRDDPYWNPRPPKLVKREVHWHRLTNLALWLAIILLPFNRRLAIFPTKPT